MTDRLLAFALAQTELGHVPDSIVRFGIRQLCEQRLAECARNGDAAQFAQTMRSSEVAPVPAKANEQHYELPPEFFGLVLGRHRKYSSCFWPENCSGLDEAEAAALALTCEHAELADGMEILELGCGWGSLSLWMAGHYPNSRITAVSNSAPQRQHIEAEAVRRGIANLRVITDDMNRFEAPGRYDRVVSVEMFEHMRNWGELLRRISAWMNPSGKLFLHVFCHREFAYAYETAGEHNWMGRYFFTGGIMPGADLIAHFQDQFRLAHQWRWSGEHYAKTAEAWLANLDANAFTVMPILARVYGAQSEIWFHRWRVFFLACAELFGYCDGREWQVGHYLLECR
ncbi:MAG: cyclopropane-fatty-acyl-phospholipid synthase family protein [Bryobacteraceae bacterium]